MTSSTSLLLDGITVPAFSFHAGGAMTISYRGAVYMSMCAGHWYMWHTYTHEGALHFSVRPVPAGARLMPGVLVNNDKLRCSFTFDIPSGAICLIGSADCISAAGIYVTGFSIPLHNNMHQLGTPSRYAIIKIDHQQVIITTPNKCE